MAARRIRHAQEVPNGKAYRKYYSPYDVHDIIHWEDGPYQYAEERALRGDVLGFWIQLQEKENRTWAARYFRRNGKVYKRT